MSTAILRRSHAALLAFSPSPTSTARTPRATSSDPTPPRRPPPEEHQGLQHRHCRSSASPSTSPAPPRSRPRSTTTPPLRHHQLRPDRSSARLRPRLFLCSPSRDPRRRPSSGLIYFDVGRHLQAVLAVALRVAPTASRRRAAAPGRRSHCQLVSGSGSDALSCLVLLCDRFDLCADVWYDLVRSQSESGKPRYELDQADEQRYVL
ncbi:uncharacterized protein A4U43_C04F20220 [Asparagus officinalis]|uniref:Uncharacterized protein n=1 Tax=Asparagus officinalis TaxID=4686 RepID=A0A5P1F2E4_ASPOF|nr:uncharacterized protein A4U43_C04F20220 [Asparagus officinalis]